MGGKNRLIPHIELWGALIEIAHRATYIQWLWLGVETVVGSISTKSGFGVVVIFSSAIVVVVFCVVVFVVFIVTGVVVLLSNSSVVVLE